jgi:hypothetical protein
MSEVNVIIVKDKSYCGCGNRASFILVEECCTGPVIDCACNGQGIGEYFCHECFNKLIGNLIDRAAQADKQDRLETEQYHAGE